jgi:hypothetical protein
MSPWLGHRDCSNTNNTKVIPLGDHQIGVTAQSNQVLEPVQKLKLPYEYYVGLFVVYLIYIMF